MTRLVKLLVAVFAIASTTSPIYTANSAPNVCSSSGSGTPRLCADDYLYPNGGYLESPNGQFRLYFGSDGSTYVDFWTGSSWARHQTVHGPMSGTAGFLYYGGTYGTPDRLDGFNSNPSVEYSLNDPSSVQTSGFVELQNDGCLRFFEFFIGDYHSICAP